MLYAVAIFVGLIVGLALEARFDLIGTAKKDTLQAYERASQMWLETNRRVSKVEDVIRGK